MRITQYCLVCVMMISWFVYGNSNDRNPFKFGKKYIHGALQSDVAVTKKKIASEIFQEWEVVKQDKYGTVLRNKLNGNLRRIQVN